MSFSITHHACTVSFDLTYEGLKFKTLEFFHKQFHCFDLTYEGLKPVMPGMI